MKKILLLSLCLSFASPVGAQIFYSDPDVTVQACSGGNTQVLAASIGTNNRKCVILTNSGATNKARCGDINVSASQGPEVPASSGSLTICSYNALYCCGEGGTTTINVGDTRIK